MTALSRVTLALAGLSCLINDSVPNEYHVLTTTYLTDTADKVAGEW